MTATIAAFLAKPAAKWIGGALALLAVAIAVTLVLRGEFNKGEKAGETAVTNAVQTETIKRVEDARRTKEKTREEVRTTPFDSRVDELQ